MKNFILILSLITFASFAEEVSRIERQAELIDFQSIREVLQRDNLEEEAEKKVEKVQQVSQERVDRTRAFYNVPDEDDFWPILSELWMVKNATVLKWDFRKPDYGIDESFKELLEELGHYDVSFKILLMDSPNIAHAYLPSSGDDYVFLLSVPFIRTMDLSRLEISILLYQDFLRARSRDFEKRILDDELKQFLGGNFQGEEFDSEFFDNLLRNYDKVLFEDGYTFQEQFQITKQMNSLFQSRERYWNTYYGLLEKIDQLVKTNFVYRQYPTIYPSPELQMGWLRPEQKRRF